MEAPPLSSSHVLIIACGALARELNILRKAGRLPQTDILFLPADLHNRPERIAAAVEERILALQGRYGRIFCAYADCGTGGMLDDVLRRHGAARLPGAHCYGFFAGQERFAALMEEDIGSFFLTDFLARHFEVIVWEGLGLDRHPQLQDAYFGHYRRVVYLAQSADPALEELAKQAAKRLGLPLKIVFTGLEGFAASLPCVEKAGIHG